MKPRPNNGPKRHTKLQEGSSFRLTFCLTLRTLRLVVAVNRAGGREVGYKRELTSSLFVLVFCCFFMLAVSAIDVCLLPLAVFPIEAAYRVIVPASINYHNIIALYWFLYLYFPAPAPFTPPPRSPHSRNVGNGGRGMGGRRQKQIMRKFDSRWTVIFSLKLPRLLAPPPPPSLHPNAHPQLAPPACLPHSWDTSNWGWVGKYAGGS